MPQGSSEVGRGGIHRDQEVQIPNPACVFSEGGRLRNGLATEMRQDLIKPIAVRSNLQRNEIRALRFKSSCKLMERLSSQ